MIDFEIKQLEYFTHAAKSGSLSKAADCCFVSPQALSKGIQTLEKTLGTTLFIRSPSGVVLTESGTALLEQAETALIDLEYCKNCIEPFKNDKREIVHMGISPLCFDERGGTLSVEKLIDFQQNHQESEFVFEEMPAHTIGGSVASGTVDLGIAPIEDDSRKLEIINLAPYPMAVIISKENPISAKNEILLTDLTHGKVVLPHRQNEGDYLPPFVKRLHENLNPAPVQTEYSDASKLISDPETFVIRPMQHALRTTSKKHVVIRPLVNEEKEPICIPLNLFWAKDRIPRAAEQKLIDFIVELYQSTH